MSHDCVAVLTSRGAKRLLKEGGSKSWRLKPDRVRQLEYCVCVQHDRLLGGGGEHARGTAFLVGRIKGVAPSDETEGRYLILFSEYAEIYRPDAWPKMRAPVLYRTLEDFGIDDPEALDWHPMPDVSETKTNHASLAEAKALLAHQLGVPESSIEITVRY